LIGLVVLPVGCAGLLGEAYGRTELNTAHTASQCSSSLTRRVVTESHVRQLEREGIVVIPHALSADHLRKARWCVKKDLEESEEKSKFDYSGNDDSVRQDRVQWVRSEPLVLVGDDGDGEKSDDGEQQPSLQDAIHLLRGVAHVLEQSGYSRASQFQIPHDCQLAVYQGNDVDGYEKHLDRCNGTVHDLGLLEYLRLSDFRCRVVTAILYLNTNDRSVDEGGQLRYWATADSPEHFHNITPVGGTLVIFDSNQIYHQVMPSKTSRIALTSWIHGDLNEQSTKPSSPVE
jgi:2OG-Fe(II) oxygenase superfamily